MPVIVTGLHIYPIKSTAATDLITAQVEPWGLAGDRRWMAVDPAGAQMTARERHRLLAVTAELAGAGLIVRSPGCPPLVVAPAPDAPRRTVSVWGTSFPASDAGDAAARWFSDWLEEPARLVHLDDPTVRPLKPGKGEPDDRVSLADAYPLLLTTSTSLGQVNDWIAEDHPDDRLDRLPMRRFRPSVVVDGTEPFAEEGWARVRIGPVTFRGGGACMRCVLTTIDPWTMARGKEPVRTLARRHRRDGKTWFGLNLVPRSRGTVRVGDEVVVEA